MNMVRWMIKYVVDQKAKPFWRSEVNRYQFGLYEHGLVRFAPEPTDVGVRMLSELDEADEYAEHQIWDGKSED